MRDAIQCSEAARLIPVLKQWGTQRRPAFSANDETGDERTSGTAAALVGIDSARASNDVYQLDLGVRRLLLLYGLAFAFVGLEGLRHFIKIFC